MTNEEQTVQLLKQITLNGVSGVAHPRSADEDADQHPDGGCGERASAPDPLPNVPTVSHITLRSS